jgi:hypothetical protein
MMPALPCSAEILRKVEPEASGQPAAEHRPEGPEAPARMRPRWTRRCISRGVFRPDYVLRVRL